MPSVRHSVSFLLFIVLGYCCISVGTPTAERGVTWSKAFPFSVEDERELGETVFKQIQKQMVFVRVSAVQAYVDSLGRKLTSNADRSEFPIRFFVLRESEPNAFAIPAGRIFLTSGLIMLVQTEDELAGVMAHEIAHVVRRHIAERIEASKRLNLTTLAGLLAGMFVGGSEGGAIMAGSLAFSEAKKLEYTRENESEADRLGLAYVTRAGYEGYGLVSFLKKIHRSTQHNPAFPSYLSTHPGVPERISYLETLMGGPPESTERVRSSDGLKDIRLRLLIVEKGPLDSLDYFTDLLQTEPDRGDALFGRALAAIELGRVKQSIEDLKRAHLLKPEDPQILKVLGLAFIRVGRVDEGVRALERSLSLSGKDAETLYYLGQGYQTQKRLPQAIESYLKAGQLYADLPELHRNLGSAYREKGEMGRSHYHYGIYFKQKGDLRYARFHFEKALELLNQDPQKQDEILRELKELKNEKHRSPG